MEDDNKGPFFTLDCEDDVAAMYSKATSASVEPEGAEEDMSAYEEGPVNDFLPVENQTFEGETPAEPVPAYSDSLSFAPLDEHSSSMDDYASVSEDQLPAQPEEDLVFTPPGSELAYQEDLPSASLQEEALLEEALPLLAQESPEGELYAELDAEEAPLGEVEEAVPALPDTLVEDFLAGHIDLEEALSSIDELPTFHDVAVPIWRQIEIELKIDLHNPSGFYVY